MLYLSSFSFPTQEEEEAFLNDPSTWLTCFNTFYPFQVLSQKGVEKIEFEPFTVLYGGNGCGKTTILNMIAEKLRLKREAPFNRTNFLGDYLESCRYELKAAPSSDSRIITSDDVFNHVLNVRRINEEIDFTREEVFKRYSEDRYSEGFRLRSMDDYERLREVNLSRRVSKSEYARRNSDANVRELSNGESALQYFSHKITQDSLYLLDEPENSLSAENQQRLAQFLEDSYRFYRCQFLISTHSPFLLAVKGARVYDMDEPPFRARKWTELKNVRAFYDFFARHSEEF